MSPAKWEQWYAVCKNAWVNPAVSSDDSGVGAPGMAERRPIPRVRRLALPARSSPGGVGSGGVGPASGCSVESRGVKMWEIGGLENVSEKVAE